MFSTQHLPLPSVEETRETTNYVERHSEDIRVAMMQGLQIDDPLKLREWLIANHVEPCPATASRYKTLIFTQRKARKFSLKSRVSVRLTRAAMYYVLTMGLKSASESDVDLIRIAATFWKQFAQIMTTPTETSAAHKCKEQGFLRLAKYLEGLKAQVIGPDAEGFPRRVGRVQKIRHLPRNWRTVVIDNVVTGIPNLKSALIAMALTGCRPEELKFTKLLKEGLNLLTISVSSSKALTGVRRGCSFEVGGYLVELSKIAVDDQAHEEFPFIHISAKMIENLLARLSRKLPVAQALGQPVSASAFRNQAASDAKAAGWSDAELATFLGHITNSQQRNYGRAKYARKGASILLPVSLIESHKVKIIPMKYPRKAEVERQQQHEADPAIQAVEPKNEGDM